MSSPAQRHDHNVSTTQLTPAIPETSNPSSGSSDSGVPTPTTRAGDSLLAPAADSIPTIRVIKPLPAQRVRAPPLLAPMNAFPQPTPMRDPPSATLVREPWKEYVHLNGGVYFYNKDLRVATTQNIHDSKSQKTVLEARDEVVKAVEKSGGWQNFPNDCEILISLEGDQIRGRMHSWREGICYMPSNEGGAKPDTRKAAWHCVSLFPMHHEDLPLNAEVDFLNALTYGANERILDNKHTTFPFTDLQAQRLVRIYQDLKFLQAAGQHVVPALAWHMARVMVEIWGAREKYKFGTPEAHIYRNISIPVPTWKVRVLDFSLLILLFGAHTTYRKRLESTRPRGSLYLPDFRTFMRSLLVEWADSNLLATVFMSVNVGFQSIPGLNMLQKTASLASSLFAMTSIATGVHHIWQHRSKTDADAEEAAKYLQRIRKFGLDHDSTVTACFLSLPLVSLLWSVLSFTVALMSLCIQGSDLTAEMVLVAVFCVLGVTSCAMLYFFWHIWKGPRHKEPEEEYNMDTSLYVDPQTWREELEGKVKRLFRLRKGKKVNVV